MASLDEVNMARHLLTLGCCQRCSLRLLDNIVNDAINFANIEEEFSLGPSSLDCKKAKPNPCIICFDILRDESLGKLFEPTIIEQIRQYDSETFKINLTVPDCIIIREFRLLKYIREKFPDYKSGLVITHKINRMSMAYRLSIQKKLEELTGKKFEPNSPLHCDIIFTHKDDLYENQKLQQLERKSCPKKYDNMKHKLISRRNMLKTLTNIPNAELKSMYPKIPSIPDGGAILSSIQVYRLSWNMGGRFIKYAKHLSVCREYGRWHRSDSLETLLKSFLAEKFRTGVDQIEFHFIPYLQDKYTVLGTGMPFFCRIRDAKKAEFSFSNARASEIEFNKLHAKYGVAVRDLQIVERDAIKQLLHYSNFSHRRCVIICSVSEANRLPKVLNTLNNLALPLPITGANINSQTTYLLRVIASRTTESRLVFGLDVVGSPGLDFDGFLRQMTYPSLEQLAGTRFIIECVNLVEDYPNWPPMVSPDVESLRSRYCVPFYSWEASSPTATESKFHLPNNDICTNFHKSENVDGTQNNVKKSSSIDDNSANCNNEDAYRITVNRVSSRGNCSVTTSIHENATNVKQEFDVKDMIKENIGGISEDLGDISQTYTRNSQNLSEIKEEVDENIIEKHISDATTDLNMSKVEYNNLLQALKKSIVEELKTSGFLSVTKLK